jgi:hypothetical protein
MSIKFTTGGIKLGAKWMQERLYSEEELREALYYALSVNKSDGIIITTDSQIVRDAIKFIKSNIILFLFGVLNEYEKLGLSVFQNTNCVLNGSICITLVSIYFFNKGINVFLKNFSCEHFGKN